MLQPRYQHKQLLQVQPNDSHFMAVHLQRKSNEKWAQMLKDVVAAEKEYYY